MVVDHPTFSGSRTLFDQHRHMRLDVDNMSYEVLRSSILVLKTTAFLFTCTITIICYYFFTFLSET